MTPEEKKARRREAARKWRAVNAEEARRYQREWRAAHPEKQREWVAANREKAREYARDWLIANRERSCGYSRRWQTKNPEKVCIAVARRRARKLHATPPWANQALIAAIYAAAARKGLEVDHAIPLQGRLVCGLHVPFNLQLLTRSANIAKGNRFSG